MPTTVNVQNNFIGGLKTEFTGLNFPENAATDTDNCIYTLIGDVIRREGIDYETNFSQVTLDRTQKAVSTFKWDNAGGDGSSQLVVLQTGPTLSFFRSSSATIAAPLSTQHITSTVDLNSFNISVTSPAPDPVECQYATGNGFLFVFHPTLDPFYCTYDIPSNTVTSQIINIAVRDFDGIQLEGNGGTNDSRPATLNGERTYNLVNQGWTVEQTTEWFSAFSEYPANSDVWWRYINSSGTFDPPGTIGSVPFRNTPAPNGHFILHAFNQQKAEATGLPVQDIATNFRPKTGTWFQGRVWYAGADASNPPFGDAPYYTWTEKIYFSQIAVTPEYFGRCYQVNDPTDRFLFDILPTDGGVITIPGCGSVYKLFPVQNGMLVFAANGIWFITGSQGIGFSATDYTITKISSVQSISSIPFVNVLGYPMFWNEEGIYTVMPDPKGSGLSVDNLCIGTILGYYNDIPLQSKKFARGDYNPIEFTVQWAFRSTNESSVTERYEFDKILNLNTANKAFFPYSLPTQSFSKLNGVLYVAGPGGSNTPPPTLKYVVSQTFSGIYRFSFAEEHDNVHWTDWFQQDNRGTNYTSYFVAGYRIAGKALTKWQPQYVYTFLRSIPNSYKIQGIWDFASSGNSGRFSTVQVINNTRANFSMLYRRHKIRGRGLALQIKVASVDGKPFDIMGWSALEQVNQGT